MKSSVLLTKEQRKNIIIGGLAAAMILTSGLTLVSAAEGDKGPHFQKNPEVEQIIQDGDYAAWQALDEGKIPNRLAQLSEEEFQLFADMIAAMKSGDTDTAKTLRVSLNLPEHPHKGMQKDIDFATWSEHMTKRGADTSLITEETFTALKAAFEAKDKEAIQEIHHELGIEGKHPYNNGDHRAERILSMTYDEWAENAAKRGVEAEEITPETFEILQQAADLFQEGDKESARELMAGVNIHPERPDHPRFERDHDDNRDKRRGHRGFVRSVPDGR